MILLSAVTKAIKLSSNLPSGAMIPTRHILFLATAALVFGQAEIEDPFAPGSAPQEVITASWERVIVQPEFYSGVVIGIDGWLAVTRGEKNLRVRLFKDRESYVYSRSQCYLIVDLDRGTREQFNDDYSKWLKLDGRRVEVQCVFKPIEEYQIGRLDHVGYLRGPFRFDFPPTDGPKKQEAITIGTPNANWPVTRAKPNDKQSGKIESSQKQNVPPTNK